MSYFHKSITLSGKLLIILEKVVFNDDLMKIFVMIKYRDK